MVHVVCTNQEVYSSVFRVAFVTIAVRPRRKKCVSQILVRILVIQDLASNGDRAALGAAQFGDGATGSVGECPDAGATGQS